MIEWFDVVVKWLCKWSQIQTGTWNTYTHMDNVIWHRHLESLMFNVYTIRQVTMVVWCVRFTVKMKWKSAESPYRIGWVDEFVCQSKEVGSYGANVIKSLWFRKKYSFFEIPRILTKSLFNADEMIFLVKIHSSCTCRDQNSRITLVIWVIHMLKISWNFFHIIQCVYTHFWILDLLIVTARP